MKKSLRFAGLLLAFSLALAIPITRRSATLWGMSFKGQASARAAACGRAVHPAQPNPAPQEEAGNSEPAASSLHAAPAPAAGAVTVIGNSMSGGPIPNPCAPPIAKANFAPTDAQAYQWLFVSGANIGDVVQWQFIQPNGSLYFQTQVSLTFSGDVCFSPSIFIAGQPAASLPGNWRARVFYNGALLLTENFTIGGSNSTVTITDHRTSGGPISNQCVPPAAKTTFVPTDPQVYQWTSFSGANIGDVVKWQFIQPNGSLYFQTQAPLTFGGNTCFSAFINIAGQPAASLLGNWQVRFIYNGTQVLVENFTLTAPACPATPISIGETKSGELTTTDCRVDGLYYADRYSFSAAAGQQVAILLTSSQFDAFLTLFGPDGSIIANDDDGGGGTNARIPPGSGFMTLAAAGTYVIEASTTFANETGSYTLSLQAGGGGASCPTVSGLNPTSGAVGSTVTISGANFTGVTTVRFANSLLAQFTVNSDTQITTTVPNGATNGPITISKPNCPDAQTASFTVTTGGGNCPTVSGINPTSGQVGSTVTIAGNNLTGVTAVKFSNNVTATFTVVNNTTITATVPSGAVTGAITISKANCTDTQTNTFTLGTSGLPGLKADYQFQGPNPRRSSVGNPPDLVDLIAPGSSTPNSLITDTVDCASSRAVLSFPTGNGLALAPTTGVIPNNTYTIVMLFKFTEQNKTRAIVDFKNGNDGRGVYADPDNNLAFPNSWNNGPGISIGKGKQFTANTYVQVVLTRTANAANPDRAGVDTGYVNGVQEFQNVTGNGDGIIDTISNRLRFFVNLQNGQFSAGAVARIRLFDRALSASEVAGLDRLPSEACPTACPTVTSLNPTSGNIGTSVTITGANFTGVTAVKFTNNVAATFTVVNETTITAVVPSNALSGVITLSKPNCPDAQTNIFTVGTSGGCNLNWLPTSGTQGQIVRSLLNTGSSQFAGTSLSGGIFRSSDNGANWTAVNSGLGNVSNLAVEALAVSGTNIFAGTTSGVFRSSDNGANWTPVNNGLLTPTNQVAGVNSLAVNGTTLLAATFSGVYRSTDQGNSWAPANTGLTGVVFTFSVAAIGTNIFVGTDHGVFRSSDNGANWTAANTGLPTAAGVQASAFAQTGTNLFVAMRSLQNQGGVFVSTNNGQSWTQINAGLTNLDVRSLAVSGTNLFAGTGGGVFLSTNNGQSWTPVSSGLTGFGLFVNALAVSGTKLLAGTGTGSPGLAENGTKPFGGTEAGAVADTGVFISDLSGCTTSTACPAVTSLNPTSGAVGSALTITGSGFTSVNAVKFSNNVSAIFTVNNDTTITATVPTGAATGPLTISKPSCPDAQTATFTVSTNSGTLAQQAYLKASNTGASDFFGYSVAISGDTMVVGAPSEASNATGVNGNQTNDGAIDSGAVYVFVRNAGVWTQQAYLKASNTGAGDQFGYSVAISGDTLVVGAPGEASNATGVNGDQTNNSAGSSGAVYVFVRNGTIWSQQAYLKASNTGAGDQFGYSVAVSGETVVVGALYEDSNATGVNGDQTNNSALSSGAAYVFVRNAGVWTHQAYLKASNTGAGDQFGEGVAISGDTVVVASFFEDSNATGVNGDQTNNSATDSGAVYVFVRSGTTWSQQAYLKASNTEAFDQFGLAVAVSGDTVVVGARGEDSNATGVNGDQTNNSAIQSGAAYVFVRNGTTWSQQAYLKASNTEANDGFGVSVAVSGDTVVVGALYEASNATGVNGDQTNNSALGSGAAYVFVRNAGVWMQQAYLKASNSGANDQFGNSVAISGDTVVVGAYREASNATGVNGNQADNSAVDSGAAYVFTIAGSSACPTVSGINPTSGQVGSTVTITGNNLTGVTAVKFSNNVTAQFTVVNDTTITATVPAGAVNGPITISKAGCNDAQTASFTVTTLGNCVSVSIANNLTGGTGSTLTVPITVSDLTGKGVTAYDFNLSFNPAVLQPLNPDAAGTLSSGLSLTTNSSVAGKLTVSAFGTTPLSGAGTLLNLKFNLVGAAGASSALTLTNFVFNEGTPCATTSNGQISIGGGSISGAVNYGTSSTPKPVPGVTMTAAGTPAATSTTNSAGAYNLTGLGGGPYTVTPSRTGDVNGISSFDASQVAQHVTGLITLSANQQIAGDASGNGTLSSFDASLIAQTVAGIANSGIAGTWKFMPASRSYPSLSGTQTNQNFDAILVGDVTGNWSAPAGLAPSTQVLAQSNTAAQVTVSLPNISGAAGPSVTIPLTVGNLTGLGVVAYDFTLSFDPNVLQLQNPPADVASTLSSGMTITPNISSPGRLVISAFSATALTGAGTLLNLKFNVVGAPGTATPLTWQTFTFNEGTPSVETVNGSFATTNPLPALTSLNPNSASSGSGALTLTVTGTNFIAGSVVRWNGSDRATSFVSSTQLTAAIPASDLSTAGTASVTVFNPAPGGGVSHALSFTININAPPARALRVVDASGAAGGTVAIPIELVAQGDEQVIGFSLTFDPTVLGNPQAVLGNGASANAQLFTNLSQLAQGRLGLALGLFGQTFAAGTRQIVVVSFTIAANPPAASTTVGFSDQPLAREVINPSIQLLATNYLPGTVTITAGLEADVAPRSNSDGAVTMLDWAQIGRFASGLETPSPGSEFQRADCAPKETKGDGRLTLADWVQAGRYAAGLDPVVPTGGPSSPSSFAPALTASAQAAGAQAQSREARSVRAINLSFTPGQERLLLLELEAQGDENALGLSLSFDPAQWRFVSAVPGSEASDAAIYLNPHQAAQGRLGFALALPAGRTLSAGAHQIAIFKFVPVSSHSTLASVIGFADQPMAREVVDVQAQAVSATYVLSTETSIMRAATIVSAASYDQAELASEAIAAAFGTGLATTIQAAETLPLPTALGGTQVVVRDSQGVERLAPLFFVSPTQINYQIPPGTASGFATVITTSGDGIISIGTIQIASVEPGLFTFTADGQGVVAAVARRFRNNQELTSETIVQLDAQNRWVARSIDLGSETDLVILEMFGTGLRFHSQAASSVTVKIGGAEAQLFYAGLAPGLVGLDQVDFVIPRSLIGRGDVDIVLMVDGKTANTVKVNIK